MASQPQVKIQERANPYTWVLVVLAIVSIAFGVLAIIWPAPTLQVLVYLFGAFVATTGVVSLVYTFQAAGDRLPWWPPLLIGIVDLIAAAVIFTYPGLTATALVYLVGIWGICAGVFEIFFSLLTARFLWLLGGLLSLMVGFVLLANPLLGELALMMVVGIFAILQGIVLLVDAIRAPRIVEMRVF